MNLFDKFDAVRFPEENLIFITNDSYIYYIYDPEYNYWKRHNNAGNDHITVANYQEISKEELMEATGGIFPQKETDFIRLCRPSQLPYWCMSRLLEEDYPEYMRDWTIRNTIEEFIRESDIHYKSYLKTKDLLDHANDTKLDQGSVLLQVKELSFNTIGRDIFKEEIGIVDGHDSSSYFWIMPVRVVDDSNTDDMDCVAEMRSAEISIEEDDVAQYLTPFLYKYFDEKLDANQKRVSDRWTDDDGIEHVTYVTGFEWWLTYNFYTFEAMGNIIKDMRDTIDALSSGKETEYTIKLREKRGWATQELLYAKDLSEEQIKEYNANRPTQDNTRVELIIDFYRRFLYRMEYMIRVGKEKGYNLISFMGP